jgi:hypothetical protein
MWQKWPDTRLYWHHASRVNDYERGGCSVKITEFPTWRDAGLLLYKDNRDEDTKARGVIRARTFPKPCVRCGSPDGEKHHWAPQSLFEDADEWPIAWLCSTCHRYWHAITGAGYASERKPQLKLPPWMVRTYELRKENQRFCPRCRWKIIKATANGTIAELVLKCTCMDPR